MANIKDKIENIRKAVFGKDVRGSLADGLEAVNKETETTTSKQEHLEETFDQLVINAGNSNAEVVDARVDKNSGTSFKKLGDRLDAHSAQMAEFVHSNDFWEVPKQPSIRIDKGDTFTFGDSRWNSEEVIKNLYDVFVDDVYCKKSILGKDQTNTYNIYEYIFEPPNYEQTILLSGGMHGKEIIPVFTLARFLHYVVNENNKNEVLQYIRNKVRIVVIPLINPWGFNQSPRIYATANGVNPNRNFPEGWDMLTPGNPVYDNKGVTPIDISESIILNDWVNKYNDASFYLDCHTGDGREYDLYLNYSDEDEYMAKKLLNVIGTLKTRFVKKYGKEPRIYTASEPNNTFRNYVNRRVGIPCATPEFGLHPDRPVYSKYEGQTEDITEYLIHLSNYIITSLKNNFRVEIEQKKRFSENANFESFYTTNSGYSDTLYSRFSLDKWYSVFDKTFKNCIATKIGTDATGLTVNSYTFNPSLDKTIVLVAGLTGRFGIRSVINLVNFVQNDGIEKYYKNYKVIVIPIVNVWGVNEYSKGSNDANSEFNSNGVNLYLNFKTANESEIVCVKNVIENNNVEGIVSFMSNTPNNIPSIIRKFGVYTDLELNYKNMYNLIAKWGLNVSDFMRSGIVSGSNSINGMYGANNKYKYMCIFTSTDLLERGFNIGHPKELNVMLDYTATLINSFLSNELINSRLIAFNPNSDIGITSLIDWNVPNQILGETGTIFNHNRKYKFVNLQGFIVIKQEGESGTVYINPTYKADNSYRPITTNYACWATIDSTKTVTIPINFTVPIEEFNNLKMGIGVSKNIASCNPMIKKVHCFVSFV